MSCFSVQPRDPDPAAEDVRVTMRAVLKAIEDAARENAGPETFAGLCNALDAVGRLLASLERR